MALTEEQRLRIEENRLKALARRQESQRAASTGGPSAPPASRSAPPTASSTLPGPRPTPPPVAQITSTPSQGIRPFGGPVNRFSSNFASNSTSQIRPPGYVQSTSNFLPSSNNIRPANSNISSNSNHIRPANSNLPSNTSSIRPQVFSSNASSIRSPSQNLSSVPTSSTTSTSRSAQSAVPMPISGRVIKGNCVLISTTEFRVDMDFHKTTIDVFKTMPTRSYNASTRKWSFGISDHEELIRKLRPLSPEVAVQPLPRFVIDALSKKRNQKKEVFVNSEDEGSFCIEPSLWDHLMPFQREGVLYALQKDGRLLLADDMGLGKTVQALAIADAFKAEWPLLIVCPSSMRFAWKNAILKWMPDIPDDEIYVITGGKDFLCNVRVIIINYDLLSKKQDELVSKKMQVIIFDECHFLKNNKSQRCKTADAITKTAKRVILLSGTPALSRPLELYSQIRLVDSSLFPYFNDFGMRYCNGKKVFFGGREGFDFSGSSNMDELQIVMKEKCMIRRLKKDVVSQLPSKTRMVIELDPAVISSKCRGQMQSQAKEMQSKGLSKSEQRGILLQWYHTTAAAKEKAVLEYIKDLLESDKKFICFAHHQVMIKSISALLDKQKVGYVLIDGATSASNREKCCHEFQTQDKMRVAVLSITAANAGITLTAAQLVVFAELYWNPGIMIQAEDRAHRIGQAFNVVVQYLVAKGTADDELWPMIRNKLKVLGEVGLGNENFIDSKTENVQHKVTRVSSGGKITDFFSNSFSEMFDDEDSFNDLVNNADFDLDSAEPIEKRPKVT